MKLKEEKGAKLAETYLAPEANSICSIPQMQELADKLSRKVVIPETHLSCKLNKAKSNKE